MLPRGIFDPFHQLTGPIEPGAALSWSGATSELRRGTAGRAISHCSLVFSVFLLLLPCGGFASQVESERIKGQEEPTVLALQGLSVDRKNLEHYRGRIVVLNFWATWCVPSREEMPILVRVREDYQARGVEIVGASADSTSASLKASRHS